LNDLNGGRLRPVELFACEIGRWNSIEETQGKEDGRYFSCRPG
jgi:hypothetical protein